MKASVRSIELMDQNPNDHGSGGWFRIFAGPIDGKGEESFDIFVCTPAWLQMDLARTPFRFGDYLLIVDRFDEALIRGLLEERVSRVSGGDWNEIAQELARFAYWEFESYRPRPTR